ncbi:MAG TPA: zf-HC2 domain-containing protein [Longimicrobiaceae bacterium]
MIEPLCCERVEIALGDYLEGDLPPQLRMRVESHLAACPECWREVQKLRHTVTYLADLPRRRMPQYLKESLLRAHRNDRSTRSLQVGSGLLPLSQGS